MSASGPGQSRSVAASRLAAPASSPSPTAGHAGGKPSRSLRERDLDTGHRPRPLWSPLMRDYEPSTPADNMIDMSIQEINGKGPKKRKKSLELICDSEGRERAELNAKEGGESACTREGKQDAGGGGGGGAVELLHWRDMPQHLQFNPYVLTGYRPLQSWTDCVRSLFYFHNETINILTHG